MKDLRLCRGFKSQKKNQSDLLYGLPYIPVGDCFIFTFSWVFEKKSTGLLEILILMQEKTMITK